MLVWNKELWLIDHGAALYFHHSWENDLHLSLEKAKQQANALSCQIKDHVLLPRASRLDEADAACREILTPALIRTIVVCCRMNGSPAPAGPRTNHPTISARYMSIFKYPDRRVRHLYKRSPACTTSTCLNTPSSALFPG
jgi:hypothetical protein